MLQWTWGYRYLFKIMISFPLDTYPEVELLLSYGSLFLTFWGNSILLSTVAAPIYIPTTFSPHPPWHLSRLFYNNHSNRCEVKSYCVFYLHFPDLIGLFVGLVFVFLGFFYYWVVWVPYIVWIVTLYQRWGFQGIACFKQSQEKENLNMKKKRDHKSRFL